MRFARPLTLVLMLAMGAAPVLAQTAPPERRQSGTLIYSGIPEIPEELRTDLQRYRNARSAGFQDWMEDGSILISTRFGWELAVAPDVVLTTVGQGVSIVSAASFKVVF